MPITEFQYREMQERVSRAARREAAQSEAIPADAELVEASLHDKILAECRRRGWIPLHGSMAHRTRRTIGEFDVVVLADGGRVFFVELKSKAGKLSTAQAALKAWAERLGHRPVVVRSLREFKAVV